MPDVSLPLKVAVITPYYRSDVPKLKRCCESVAKQTYACDHILVADGEVQDVFEKFNITHMQLPHNVGNSGATPRGLGAQYAFAQGYDAVLDAQAAWLLSQKGWQVIDIRPDLRNAIAGAKKTDPKFVYASDRVHPGQQGHDFIAASVIRQWWPIWQLPGKPASTNAKAISILSNRHITLQRAWLKKTGHKRPGVPDGLPLEEAESQAAKLLKDYLAASLNAIKP
jgi:hypothetical protein